MERSNQFQIVNGPHSERTGLWKFSAILLSAVVLISSCGGSDTRNTYIREFNPILENHITRFGKMAIESGAVISGLSAQSSQSQKNQALSQYAGFLELEAAELRKDIAAWLNLTPPPEADEFHDLIFEMMSLRMEATDALLGQFTGLARGFNMDDQVIDSAGTKMIRSDQLYGEAIIEVRKLDR